MGRGTIGVAVAPRMVAQPAADDHRLVAAVRGGDDRAFEALYQRYQRRIAAYVLGMVKDHGRAEDVTQEVFVSALRRIRETERPIAFKPWIYEIAKNACIDQFRRSRHAEEVSFDAEEGLAPADYGRLVGSGPTPDAAVAAKQELDNLCGAFGGLSDTHHEILVLRELEGLSYREIGERMGLSRPAVESTLFRARRRLTEEYDELVTGARCERVHRVIQAAAGRQLGARESRRLARHVAHCQPCRREALAAGLDEAVLTHVPLRRRAAARIGALLPLPGFLRLGRGPDAPVASLAGPGGGPPWVAQLPALSEQLSGGWGKLATAAAVVVAGLGAAGAGTQHGHDRGDRDRPRAERAADQRTDAGSRRVAAIRPPAAAPAKPESSREKRRPARSRARTASRSSSAAGATTSAAPAPATPPASAAAPEPATTAPRSDGGGDDGAPPVSKPKVPPVTAAAGATPAQPLAPVVETVQQTTAPVTGPVAGTVDPVTDTVDGATGGATQPLTDTVDGTVGGLVP